jgi:hypothetical protein
MRRTIRSVLTLAAALAASGEARAQYGYGGGCGGWGASTPGSSMARGLGMMGMGAGMYMHATNSGSVKVPGLHPQPIFSGRLLCYRACFTWSALARLLSTGGSHVRNGV